jgi:hypothetical protein
MFQFSENKEQMLARKYVGNIRSDRIPIQCRSDILVDVANKLGEARVEARGLNDRLLLYMIDVAIFHAHEMLERQSDLGEHEKWS